jgi:hypothetical protein
MPLKPGQTNNPKGRPKGVSNRATKSHREFMDAFIKKNRKRLNRDWILMTPFQRIQMFEKLSGFLLPRKSSLDIENLNDDQLSEIFNQLLKTDEQPVPPPKNKKGKD